MVAPKEFKIGLLTPVQGPKPIRGQYMKKAASYIIDRLNKEKAVPGFNLTYTMYDTECIPSACLSKMGEARRDGVKAFIGPACEFNCISAARLAAQWQMPMISYACQSNIMTDAELNPYFARTIHTFLETGRFIGVIVDHFDWENVYIVITSYFISVWLELVDEISRNYAGVLPRQWHIDLNDNVDMIRKELAKYMNRAYVFILCMFPHQIQLFLSVVSEEGYYTKGRAFLAVDFLNTYRAAPFTGLLDITMDVNLSSPSFRQLIEHIRCPTEQCEDIYTLVLNESIRDPESLFDLELVNELCCRACGTLNGTTVNTLAQQYRKGELKSFRQFSGFIQYLCIKLRKEHFEDFLHPALMTDAFILLTKGLSAVVENSSDPRDLTEHNAKIIINTIKQARFTGITGSVHINSDGTRFSHLSLNNLVNGTYKVIAKTDYDRVKYRMVYKEKCSDITWPGNSKQTPLCPPNLCPQVSSGALLWSSVSVVAVLLVFLAVAAYRKYRHRRERRSQKKNWLIKSEKLYSAPAFTGKLGALVGGARRNVAKKIDTDINAAIDVSRDSIRTFVMGHIFAKVTVLDDQVVAVKPVNKETMELTKAAILEVNQVIHLKHTNVNQLVGACTEPGNVCLVWEYCAKGSLQDVLQNVNIKLDWIFRLSFMTDIAKGMAYLHSGPVQVHGRLKSTNVVVDNNWCCKITDFSMPCFRQNEIENSFTCDYSYSLLWTGPELLRDPEKMVKGTKKGDVYSFGIIIQEIVTRNPPFNLHMGGDPRVIVGRVKTRESPPYRPKVPLTDENEGPETGARLGVLDMMIMCWDEYPLFRLSFSVICHNLKKLRQAYGPTANLVDQMLTLVRKYADNLEELVEERTEQLGQEQQKTEELLSRMLPKSVAQELKLGLPVVPECYLSVTLYFSDILDFADIAQKSTPIEVVNLLNDLYILFDRIIDTYDAYKVETIADNYVVASGLPQRNEDRHAAVIATLSLDLLINVLGFRIRHMPQRQLLLRIGIHTGPVVAGVVGKKMPRYCLFGDTVNYTSRVESNGLPLHIHVSPECKEYLDTLGGFDVKERGLVEMKGKGRILTYFLLGKKEGLEYQVPELLPGIRKMIGVTIPNVTDQDPTSAFQSSNLSCSVSKAIGSLWNK